jgi:hypothetical protein
LSGKFIEGEAARGNAGSSAVGLDFDVREFVLDGFGNRLRADSRLLLSQLLNELDHTGQVAAAVM